MAANPKRLTPSGKQQRRWQAQNAQGQRRPDPRQNGHRPAQDSYDKPQPLPAEAPSAEHAERALIALALDAAPGLRHPAIHEVERIRLEKFRDHQHRAVAGVLQARRTRGEDSDLITVFEELKFGGLIGIGGACVFESLNDFASHYLSSDLVTCLDAAEYASQIHRAYAQRITIERARDLYVTATQGIDEIAAALPIIVTEINAANREAASDDAYNRFAPVDMRLWRNRPRARILDAEMGLREGQTLMIYGETNSGKTLYLLYRLALLATGHLTGQPEHVLYYAGEGQAGLMGRIEALLLFHHLDVDTFYEHFHLVPDMPQIVTAPDELAAAIELAKELDVAFTVVALDTLTTAMSGLNDDKAEYMTAVYGAMRHMARELGATPIVVHHPGKDLTRGPRGNSAMKNGLDMVLIVSQDTQTKVITIAHDKMRDGEKQRWAYRIVRQLLPGDEWSTDPQPVLQAGATPAALPAPKSAKLDATAQQVWQVLYDSGGLKWNAWMNRCETQGINPATAKSAMFRIRDAGRTGKIEETGEWKAIPAQESG